MFDSVEKDMLAHKVNETDLWIDSYHAIGWGSHQQRIKELIEAQIMQIRNLGAMTEAFHLTVRLHEGS